MPGSSDIYLPPLRDFSLSLRCHGYGWEVIAVGCLSKEEGKSSSLNTPHTEETHL